MRKQLISLGVYLMFLTFGILEVNSQIFTQRMDDLWKQGKKSEVYEIAQKRLKDNPKDVAALLLKLDYEMSRYDLEFMEKTTKTLIPFIEEISTPNFSKQKNLLKADLIAIQRSIKAITPEVIQTEKEKIYPNKPLTFKYAIEALEADGLILPIQSSENISTFWQKYRWVILLVGSLIVSFLVYFLRKPKGREENP